MESPERSHRRGREGGDQSDGYNKGSVFAEEHKLIGVILAMLCDFLPKVPQPCPTVPIHGIRWMVANGWYCSLDPTAGRLSP